MASDTSLIVLEKYQHTLGKNLTENGENGRDKWDTIILPVILK